MHPVLASILLLSLCGVARAGDFTGVYGGFSTGYALDRERETAAAEPYVSPPRGGLHPGAGGGPAADLPPSAAGAAATLKRSPLGARGAAAR